jgi:hypothetical protein
MNKYEVEIIRVSYANKTFVVDAESKTAASDLAFNLSYNEVFSESTAEYELGYCEPISNQKPNICQK